MILCKRTFVVCLLAGFVVPLHGQVNPQPKTKVGQQPINVCPQGRCLVDLCKLAVQLDQSDVHDPGAMVLEAPKGRQHRLPAHDEIKLSYAKKEQIIWTCSEGKGFQITQIHKVIGNECDQSGPDMPFDLKSHTNLFAPQKPGVQLASGPPVQGTAGHSYKFSFIIARDTPPTYRKNAPPHYDQSDPRTLIAGKLYDPHIIVTGGDTGRYGCPHPTPTPYPSPSPHKDEKSSQKGGKAQ